MMLIQTAALAACLVGGTASLCRSVAAYRAFRGGRNKPLLVNVTPQRLSELRPRWPFREQRWPRPAVADQAPMHRDEAAAYARLARRGQRRSVIWGQALGVIGGAWLGVSLPATWDLLTNTTGIDYTSPAFMQLIGVLALIELALLISDQANDFEAVANVYFRHAEAPGDDLSVTTGAHTSELGRFWNWLRGR